MRPFRHSNSEGPNRENSIEWNERNVRGYPLEEDKFPKQIFGTSSSTPKDYRLPELFYGYGCWVISSAAAEIFRQFDLGQGALYPVDVLERDRITPINGPWFCINFGNRKSAFIPEKSTRFRHDYVSDGKKGWFPRLPYNDNNLSVSREALFGPDVWIDPDVGSAFFISDGLGVALKNAKLDRGFMLGRCQVV